MSDPTPSLLATLVELAKQLGAAAADRDAWQAAHAAVLASHNKILTEYRAALDDGTRMLQSIDELEAENAQLREQLRHLAPVTTTPEECSPAADVARVLHDVNLQASSSGSLAEVTLFGPRAPSRFYVH